MSPLRIVLVMIEPPLPFGHAIGRWYYVLLRGLVERGHRVTAFAACSKAEEIPAARALFPAPKYDLRLYPFPPRGRGPRSKLETVVRPYSYMFSGPLKADLERGLAAGFDVLHLDGIWTGWAGLRHTGRSLLNVHSLYRVDLAAEPPTSMVEALQRRLLYAAERAQLRRYPWLTVLSDRLADEVRGLIPGKEVGVCPLGLDPSLYAYLPDDRRPDDPVVSMIGSMGWAPSRSAAVRLITRLWPAIRDRVPAARVQVVGWGARAALADYLGAPGVTVEEDVPDTRPYFERTAVLLYAPERGSGMKIKILEALGYGVPVVTTPEGVEGLPAVDGVHAGVADDDAGLVDRTVRLLSDPAARGRQRARGRELLEAHCGPGPTVDRIEQMYHRILAASGR